MVIRVGLAEVQVRKHGHDVFLLPVLHVEEIGRDDVEMCSVELELLFKPLRGVPEVTKLRRWISSMS